MSRPWFSAAVTARTVDGNRGSSMTCSGQIGCVVPGLGDQLGDPAQVLLVDILSGPGLGGIEKVRRIRGGVVDELQIRDRQVGQHLTNVDAFLLQLFDPVGDVGHRGGVRDSLGEVGSVGPGVDE